MKAVHDNVIIAYLEWLAKEHDDDMLAEAAKRLAKSCKKERDAWANKVADEFSERVRTPPGMRTMTRYSVEELRKLADAYTGIHGMEYERDGYLWAAKEIEDLTCAAIEGETYRLILKEIANDGCIAVDYDCGSWHCRNRYPGDRGEWCWSCMAAEALEGKNNDG